MKLKTILFFTILLYLYSCKSSKYEDNSYEIISLVYKDIAKPIETVFPPPPPNGKILSKKDSNRIDSFINKIKKDRLNKKLIVAINPNPLSIIVKGKIKKCVSSESISKMHSLPVIKLSEIGNPKKDSIIFFNEKLLGKESKDFYNFDILLNFSNILFNKARTKAIVIASASFSKLSSYSKIYLLEKKNNIWTIVCSEGLSIS